MKKFLIAGLITAIGAVALISQANARGNFCYYNPDAPQCQDYGPYDGGGYPPPPPNYGEDYPPPPRPHHHNSYDDNYNSDSFLFDNGDYNGPTINLQFGNSGRKSCSSIANSLRRSGFRRVVPVDCAGSGYAFKASRDGQVLRVSVVSATGRISQIRPYY
jgi:hypothetical protein